MEFYADDQKRQGFLAHRRSGVLLHVTSLPSQHGVGDFGRGARSFSDFLADAGQAVWQMLPLNPTSAATGNSPYSSGSAFALDPLFLSPEGLAEEGLVSSKDLDDAQLPSARAVDYTAARKSKGMLLRLAIENFQKQPVHKPAFESFCHNNSDWLEDYAAFVAIQHHLEGLSWSLWPQEIRERSALAMKAVRHELADDIQQTKILQFLADAQWHKLKRHCDSNSIQILGDLPIYVTYESADVWAHRDRFQLDARGRLQAVAGVPPDYFSETGQLWGSPLYDWKREKEAGYDWWQRRLRRNLVLYDAVRIDHFRAFSQYWSIPAGAESAIAGEWRPGPGASLFNSLPKDINLHALVAEDLGIITPDVVELMQSLGFPGMRVLQFGFGEDYPKGTHSPAVIDRHSVVFTGTHDNNTSLGWFDEEASSLEKANVADHHGEALRSEHVAHALWNAALRSPAQLAIAPMQDLLGLPSSARMNRPASAEGNWTWRLASTDRENSLSAELASSMLDATTSSSRHRPIGGSSLK